MTPSNDVRIAVQEVGAGEPILLIPGLGYASWSFVRQVDELATVGRVLAIDNRGSGRSDKPAGPISIETMADDAHHVLQACGAGPATVVGTSMGGYVAQTLAQKYPDAVKNVVLVATTSGGPGSVGVPEKTLRAWDHAARGGVKGFARATMPLSLAPGWCEAHPDEFEELLAMREASPTPIESWRSQFEACVAFLYRGLGPNVVAHPTVIVHGTADRVVPYANVAHLMRRYPHAKLHTMPGAGHLCWIERHEEFNDVVRATFC
jgi:pimeloyl-ACP methyl ester carboxylesterase